MPVAISNLSATWSNSNIAFTAISMNVANNGSNADSRLLDLKVDGISKQYITPNGDIYITGFYHGDGSMLTGIIAGGGATDNIARLIANTAYDKANSANILAFQVGGAVTTANTIASAAFDKANAANVLAFNSGAGSNTYLLATIAGANAAVGAGANAFATAAAAGANAYMIAVQNGANTDVGTGANAFTSATIAGANTAVGTGANTYLLATLSGANTAVGTGANAFATAATAGANAYMIAVQNGANTAVGGGANAFTSATITGANTAVGTGANTYLLTTLSGANTAVGTGANAFTSATIAGANTAVGGGANAFATAAAAGANAFMIAVQAGSNTAVGTGANAFTSATIAGANTAVGAGANTYLLATIAGANTAVGLGANNYSNATFLKLTAAAQTLTGNLNIVGNFTLSGNTVFIDATRLQIDDPLIYLAGNNYTSDIVDIGFIGNYVNATGANVHTGLYREHTDKMYYLFNGYDKEPENNHIGALSNNMTLAVLNADIRTSNLSLGGVNALITITSAFDKANAANLLAFNTGSGSNTYILATIAGANAAVGAGANAFSAATIAGANTAVGAGANTVAIAAFAKANSTTYTSNVVISVADNTNAALRITQTGTGEAIRVEDSSNPDSTPFVVDASGNVGIGGSATTQKLTVYTNTQSVDGIGLVNPSGGAIVLMPNTGSGSYSPLVGTNDQAIIAYGTTTDTGNLVLGIWSSTAKGIKIQNSGNVLIGRSTSTVGQDVKLDVNGAVNASAVLINGTPSLANAAGITTAGGITVPGTIVLAGSPDGVRAGVLNYLGNTLIVTPNTADWKTSLRLISSNNATFPDIIIFYSNNNTSMFDARGNLLIGRTDSTVGQGVKLDVNGAVNASALFVTGNVNFDSVAATKIVEPAANTLTFHTTQTERMRITSTGEVGVGTATPFPLTTTFVSTRDPLIASDGSYIGGGAYWDGATWRSTVASQGGWVIRNTSGQFALWTGYNSGAANTVPTVFTERLRVDGNGNIGIGTSSPAAKLDVAGTGIIQTRVRSSSTDGSNLAIISADYGNGSTLQLRAAANYTYLLGYTPTSSPLYITSNSQYGIMMTMNHTGNVGIGTTAPSSIFEVSGDAVNSLSNLGTSDNATITITNTNVGSLNRIAKTLYEVGNLPIASVAAAYTVFNAGSNIGGDLIFSTQRHLGTGVQERMRIDSAGNIGIGTTSPDAKLVVIGGGQGLNFNTAGPLEGSILVGDSGTAAQNGGSIVFSAASEAWKFGAIKSHVVNGTSNTAGDIAVLTRRSIVDSTLTETIRFQFSGNVLIGRAGVDSTVGNNVKLDVNGAVNASAVLINGTPALTGGITSNVVISVADNTNAALRITQTGTGEAIRVEDSANPDATPFIIDALGNVVIGYTDAHGKVTISTQAGGANQTNNYISLRQAGALDNVSTRIAGLGYANNVLAAIDFNQDSLSAFRSRIVFSTTPSGTLTERMRIDETGNVLIGRTTSTVGQGVKLDVNGAINASAVLINGVPALTGGITSNVVISVADNTNAALRITQTGTGDAIRVEDSANPDSSPFVVDANGNVGIGTTSPVYHIDAFAASGGVTGSFRTNGTTGSDYGNIQAVANGYFSNFIQYGSGVSVFATTGTQLTVQTNSTSPITFVTNLVERMRIDSSGNTLIGRTTSTVGQNVKLDVAGAINVASVLINGTALTAATQAEQEAASSTTTYVSPGRQHFHPSAAKFWAHFGVTGNLLAGYNVTSITDGGAGVATVVIATDFGTADYCVGVSIENLDATIDSIADGQMAMIANGNQLADSVRVINKNDDGTAATDPATWNVWGFGDLA
jgi:hypothetical protein